LVEIIVRLAATVKPPKRRDDRMMKPVLEETLEKAGMTADALAEASGLSPEAVRRLCSGNYANVRVSTLDAVCGTLGCQPGDVLCQVPDSE
jgi:putative transcriptional regulator